MRTTPSPPPLFRFSGSTLRTKLTPFFVQRLFEEVVTYKVNVPAADTPPPAAADDATVSPETAHSCPISEGHAVPPTSHVTPFSASSTALSSQFKVRMPSSDRPGKLSSPPRSPSRPFTPGDGEGGALRSYAPGQEPTEACGGDGFRKDGEMDFKTFLDLLLAMENKQTPQVCRLW